MNELEKLQEQPRLFGIKYKFVWVKVIYENGDDEQYRNFSYSTIKSFIQVEFVDGKKYRLISKYNWRYINDNLWQPYIVRYGSKLYFKITLPILISLISLRITCTNLRDNIAYKAEQERQKELQDSILMVSSHFFLTRADSVDLKVRAVSLRVDSLSEEFRRSNRNANH